MFSFGPAQVLILGLVVVLLFGKHLPSRMRSLGASLSEFRRGLENRDEAMD